MTKTSISQTTGGRPRFGGANVNFRRLQVIGFVAVTSGGQHFSVQERRQGKPPTLILHQPVALRVPVDSTAKSPSTVQDDKPRIIRSESKIR